jgi:general secretion pathway protein I
MSAGAPMRSPPLRTRARRARGFTLLEVMLAFVLLAASLGMLVGMLSGGLRQVSGATRDTEATLHAQSLLESVGTLTPIVPGHTQGELDDGRYRWTLDIAPMDDPAPVTAEAAAAPPLQGGPVLYRIELAIAWAKGGPREQLHFVTLRARTPVEVTP